jgi:hypothetical protein
MHKTLKLRPNLMMAIAWAAVLTICLYQGAGTGEPLIAALLLGGFAVGALQSLALSDTKAGFLEASTPLQVREAMRQSAPGRLAIYLQWICGLTLVVALFITDVRSPLLSGLACFAAFGLARELASLPGVLALRRRARSPLG